jgi:hypothetical protein
MSDPNFHYILLDTRHPEYETAIKKYETEHKRVWPKNNLSVVLNVDGTQAIVKVDAGLDKPTWTAKAQVADKTDALVIKTWTPKTLGEVHELLQTKEWKRAEETP